MKHKRKVHHRYMVMVTLWSRDKGEVVGQSTHNVQLKRPFGSLSSSTAMFDAVMEDIEQRYPNEDMKNILPVLTGYKALN
jgi:hypothetical protein